MPLPGGQIAAWIDEVARLVAETTTPDVAARLGEPDAAAVLANRVAWDHFDHVDEATAAMPFFVVCEAIASWKQITYDGAMKAEGVVEVHYLEHATRYPDQPSLMAEHRESKRHYASFISEVIEDVAKRFNEGRSLRLTELQLVIPTHRTPIPERDPHDPVTDYWHSQWAFFFEA